MKAFRETGALLFFPKGALTHHLVVAKSVFLRFCLAAKTADTPLLLLSPQSRLCGDPFGGGISFGNRALISGLRAAYSGCPPKRTCGCSARRMWLHLRSKCRRKRRLTSETLACGVVCGSLMDNATSPWAAVIVHAVGKELPIWKLLIWAGNSPTHSAACLRKSATGSFVAVMGASCFVTHPFSFLRKRNKKKGR